MKLTAEQRRNVTDYCMGCLKYNASKYKCKAFTDPFPLWTHTDQSEGCWARTEDPNQVRRELADMILYAGNNSDANVTHMRKELSKFNQMVDKEIHEVLNESPKTNFPYIQGGGGGEKADRTNKTFGPQAMKDNRFMHRKLNPRREDWNE